MVYPTRFGRIIACSARMKMHLTETGSWTGILFDLMIDSGTAIFTGKDIYRGRFPDRMTLRSETIEQLEGALMLLEVFDWRTTYQPEDVGSTVDDGGSWSLDASNRGRSVSSRGDNASPSYRSANETTLHEERYGLLREATFEALRFSVPFGFKPNKLEAEQASGGNGG
jgi:hypothetical protein